MADKDANPVEGMLITCWRERFDDFLAFCVQSVYCFHEVLASELDFYSASRLKNTTPVKVIPIG